MHRTDWLAEFGHPSAGVDFSLPNGIYFLLEFLPELKRLGDKSLHDRLAIYFWWEAIGARCYPDFTWQLRKQDQACLDGMSDEHLCSAFPRAIDFWLRHTDQSGLERDSLMQLLTRPVEDYADPLLQLPYFLYVLRNERDDLQRDFDLTNASGRLAYLFWWNTHGRREYPRMTWSIDATLDALSVLERSEHAPLAQPRMLSLVWRDRPGLQTHYSIQTLSGQLAYWNWWQEMGHTSYPRLAWTPDAAVQALFDVAEDHADPLLRLPHFLHILRNERDDLQRDFNLDNASGRLAYLNWWHTHGRHEYPRLQWSAAATIAGLSVLERPAHAPLAQPRLLNLIWNDRPDLRSSYPSRTIMEQLAYWTWWQKNGHTSFPTLEWTPQAAISELLEPAPATSAAIPGLPRLLDAVWNENTALHAHFDRTTFKGECAFLLWWHEFGQTSYPAFQWSAKSVLPWLTASCTLVREQHTEIPRFLVIVWNSRQDLQAACTLQTRDGIAQLVHWWNNAGRDEYGLLKTFYVDTDTDERYIARQQYRETDYPFGVNIVGFPQGILGLAEDARMMGHALELADVPRAYINAPMAGPAKVDNSVRALLVNQAKYRISVFCLPPPEMMRLALEGGRGLIDDGTYKVGAWPWELPHWPTAFARVHCFVDEIWAQSKYVQTAFSKLSDTPVHHMPMAVEIPVPTARVRTRFGLPEQDFLFYLMFDGNSWLTRKNPLAGVHAFQKAFASSVGGVGLVVKAMNIRESDPTWQLIREAATRDPRIRIVSETLTRQDTINFMSSCDAYISLHRSEGFGRVIAEAMSLGQPVIVTNFSGNVDYCDAGTAFLVDGELLPLRPGEYLFPEGQYWCDPDIEQAAEQLQRVVEDAATRATIAAAGRKRLRDDYSFEAVSRRYSVRIADIAASWTH